MEVVHGKLSTAAFLDSSRAVGEGRMEQMFASLSNLIELKSAAAMDDYNYKFDHFNVEKVFDIMPLTVALTCGPVCCVTDIWVPLNGAKRFCYVSADITLTKQKIRVARFLLPNTWELFLIQMKILVRIDG